MGVTVLVVDDDEGILETIRILLTREGYHVLTAKDGKVALDLMSTHTTAASVSTILCDLEMPNMDGKELIARIRKQFPEIPIVVLSGASDTMFLDGIIQEGVGDWLRKPVTREALLEKVRMATNLFALRQQRR